MNLLIAIDINKILSLQSSLQLSEFILLKNNNMKIKNHFIKIVIHIL